MSTQTWITIGLILAVHIVLIAALFAADLGSDCVSGSFSRDGFECHEYLTDLR